MLVPSPTSNTRKAIDGLFKLFPCLLLLLRLKHARKRVDLVLQLLRRGALLLVMSS